MAIYHASVKMISRSAGRSSVAAAAYRSGTCLENDYDGRKHDFQKKQWVSYTKIILPEHAPSEYQDRSVLWNAVEKSEKTSNAQLAREVELALPKELTLDQQIQMVQDYVQRNFVNQGMCADIAIHSPPRTNDRHQPIDSTGHRTSDKEKMIFENPHAHIMLTVRPIDESGKWEAKSQKVYLCKKGDAEKGFTASEYVEANKNGWEKQYQFQSGKNKVWCTMQEGQEKNLERINRSPKTERFGRKNPVTEYWNSKDRIIEWRKDWEITVNKELERIGSDERVDSRSFMDQGREQELPTIHMGVAASNMEKRAAREALEGIPPEKIKHSDIGTYNSEVENYNSLFRQWKEKIAEAWGNAKSGFRKLAEELEELRGQFLKSSYELAEYQQHHSHKELEYQQRQAEFSKMDHLLEATHQKNAESRQRISEAAQRLKECSIWDFREKHVLHTAIDTEKAAISTRNEYVSHELHRLGYQNPDQYQKSRQVYKMEESDHKKYVDTVTAMQERQESLRSEIHDKLQNVPPEEQKELAKVNAELGGSKEKSIREKLRNARNQIDERIYQDAEKLADAEMGEFTAKRTEKQKRQDKEQERQ